MISVFFIGRIGAKGAEVIEGKKGKFVSMDVATDIYSQGENKADWVRVRCNKPNIIALAENGKLGKGSHIQVNGLQTFPRAYMGKDGQPHAQTVVIAETIQYVSGKRRDDAQQPASTPQGERTVESVAADGQQPFPAPQDKADDLPF